MESYLCDKSGKKFSDSRKQTQEREPSVRALVSGPSPARASRERERERRDSAPELLVRDLGDPVVRRREDDLGADLRGPSGLAERCGVRHLGGLGQSALSLCFKRERERESGDDDDGSARERERERERRAARGANLGRAVDAGPVLRASVVALAHGRRRVVRAPEDAQELAEGECGGIEDLPATTGHRFAFRSRLA